MIEPNDHFSVIVDTLSYELQLIDIYSGIPMEEQMGRYAGIHRDRNDCPGHYSTMIMRSRLPKNYRPPRIVLPGLGVFTNLEDFVGFTFHKQHEHVRMAPYPLPGTPPLPTAYRFALIHYTPQRMATAKTRQRIGTCMPS